MVSAKPRFDAAELLRGSKVFGALPSESIARLASSARAESYDIPTLLHRAGEPVAALRLVLAGHIEVSVRRASGAEVALAELGPGAWVPWLGSVIETKSSHDLYSSAHARYLSLPTAAVRAACQQHPDLYLRILNEIGARMQQLMEWTAQSVLLMPEQRLAKLLHVLAKTHGIEGNAGVLHVTQERLARLAGCSRQSVILLLNKLKKRGLVRGMYGRLWIDDLAALHAYTEVDAEDAPD
jgi:CRP-like cAMP-binding protein